MTEVDTEKYTVLVSYSTPVAYYNKISGGLYRTDKFWSKTTSRHINKWLDGREAETMSQATLNTLI